MSPEAYLARARDLAELARGRTSPNPMVGCVVVRAGRIVGEGYHTAPGQPHAEREALAAAGDEARGATLYCTLEPCCHHGRTPPCTAAIIAAGVTEVVYAVDDPDPQVAGRGAAALRAAGLTVRGGLLRTEVERQLEAYLHQRRSGRPWVVAKWAMTLDGKLASAVGDSRWVSGPAARRRVHELRDRVDAVLVGAQTVLADDPALTCRLEEAPRPTRNPLRVVVDTHGRTPPAARLFTDGAAPTILAVGEAATVAARPGVELWRLPERDGRVDLEVLLQRLAERGVVEVLSEAGGTVTGGLFAAGLVDRVVAFIAPKLVGGRGPTPWDEAGRETMAAAVRLEQVEMERCGDDLLVTGRVGRE